MENTCVICGNIIPEGRQICLKCENEVKENISLVIERAKRQTSLEIIEMIEHLCYTNEVSTFKGVQTGKDVKNKIIANIKEAYLS